MEVEVKVSLADRAGYDKVLATLAASGPLQREDHEDYFLDGPNGELLAANACLRIRFCGAACTITVKEHADVSEGSSIRWQHSEDVDPAAARAALAGQLPLPGTVAAATAAKCGLAASALKSLGGFRCLRTFAPWPGCTSQPGLSIRLDATDYPFGRRHSIEVPHVTVPVHDVIDELAAVLTGLGVAFTVGAQSKYATLHEWLDTTASSASVMTHEVKLALASAEDFAVVATALQAAGGIVGEAVHIDDFYDGPEGELQKQGAMLRVRTDNGAESGKCSVAIKEHTGVSDGSALYWGRTEAVAPSLGPAMRQDPAALFTLGTERSLVVHTLVHKFGVSTLRAQGSLKTWRRTFAWPGCTSQPGLSIRLDDTEFPLGHRYEIEVPNVTVPVHDVIDEIGAVLQGLGVGFQLASANKFATLRSNLMP